MNSSKNKILAALRSHEAGAYPMPDLGEIRGITYDDPVQQFIEKTTTTAGASVVILQQGEDLNAVIRRAYPEAKVIASNIIGVDAQLNPDKVDAAAELTRADLGVIYGTIGVAENACIWIPQTMKERAICFASEYLMILLNRQAIVSNMHQAYAKIQSGGNSIDDYKFGTFISGPSKTADIESALVYGAQAARGVTVLLI